MGEGEREGARGGFLRVVRERARLGARSGGWAGLERRGEEGEGVAEAARDSRRIRSSSEEADDGDGGGATRFMTGETGGAVCWQTGSSCCAPSLKESARSGRDRNCSRATSRLALRQANQRAAPRRAQYAVASAARLDSLFLIPPAHLSRRIALEARFCA